MTPLSDPDRHLPAKLVDSSMIEHATQCCVMSTDEIDQLGLGSREKKSYPLHQDEVRTYPNGLLGVVRIRFLKCDVLVNSQAR